MDNPSNADLDMIEALLATMQQNPGQLYDDVDDDDDDDYEDDDDDDDDDDGYYPEHNIHTLLNPYGGDGGDMAGGDGQMQMPNVQTMNFLQGLLNMNNSGMAEIEAAIGSSMGGGIGGMGGPMDGGAGGFIPNMQSLLPNMGTEMAGALAGAFAGGMNSLMEYGQHGDPNHEDYDDEDDDDDDDDVLSDEEEEEDGDEDDEDELHGKHHGGINPSMVLGGVGGLMAAGLLAGGSAMGNLAGSQRGYPDNYHPPALMPPPSAMLPPSSMPPPSSPPVSAAMLTSSQASSPPPVGFCVPSLPPPSSGASAPAIEAPTSRTAPASIASTSLGSMSGGTVSKADPLAALVAGVGGAAVGAGVLAPIVSNLLGNSGGTTVVNKLNSSNCSASTVIGNNDSLNSSSKTLPDDSVDGTIAATKVNPSQPPKQSTTNNNPSQPKDTPPPEKTQPVESQTKIEDRPKTEGKSTKEECDDDKASLDSTSSSNSETSGGGKSDTESVGKKTPSPVPEGTESSNSQEVGSCGSIPDLASATESMRDSDTDNHSEAHNVTANLSDLDNDVQEHQKTTVPVNQYPVGPLPVVVEHPTYGWGSMVGLDTAKDALKNLFIARSFPAVFEGTEGSCKGVLLFGPSGSGKTCLARALAKEVNNALFVGISSRYLLTHNPFDAIKLVKCMFDQARHEKPAVILFDEIEALCYHPNNESAIRAKDEILAQVRGLTTLPPAYPPRQEPSSINEGIMVLGTTNQPWLVEERLRRVFAYNIHVKLPGEKPRHELFRTFLQNLPHNINEEEFQCLVSKSDGYSAADINTVIRQASHRVPLDPKNESGQRLLTFDDLATIMTQYRSRFNDELRIKYSAYISAATHRAEQLEENAKEKKDKPKGVKKFSHRIAKSLAAAVLAVID